MNRREKIIFRADLYFFLLIFLFLFVSTQTASVYKYLRLAWKTPNLQFICFGRDFMHTHSQFHTSTKNAIMCKNIEKLLVINLFHIIYSILFSLLFYFFRFFLCGIKKDIIYGTRNVPKPFLVSAWNLYSWTVFFVVRMRNLKSVPLMAKCYHWMTSNRANKNSASSFTLYILSYMAAMYKARTKREIFKILHRHCFVDIMEPGNDQDRNFVCL